MSQRSNNGSGFSPSPPDEYRSTDISLTDPRLYINRELSWLSFNERVLEEARDPSVPLLERLRFLAISASNLDEFFEVRVAGLQEQIANSLEPQDTPPDGMGPLTQLVEISKLAHDFVSRQYQVWQGEIRPDLEKHGILLCEPDELDDAQNTFLDNYFDSQIYPVLTPLAIDPAHPFPHLHNKSLNLILRIEAVGQDTPRQLYAVLQVPGILSRIVELPDAGDGKKRFILLRDVIGPRMDSLFGGFRVSSRVAFRVTRNSDLSIQENEVKSSLLSTIQETLRQRKWGEAVRLEISEAADDGFVKTLQAALDLDDRDIYRVPNPVDLTALLGLCRIEGFRDIKEPLYEPQLPVVLANRANIFPPSATRTSSSTTPMSRSGRRPVHRASRRRPRRPGHQADPLPHRRSQPDHHRPGPRRRERQAGHGPRRTSGPARRGEQHRQGPDASRRPASTSFTASSASRPTARPRSSCVARKSTASAATFTSERATITPPPPGSIPTSASSPACPRFGEDASALFNLLTGYSQGNDWKKLDRRAPINLADRVIDADRARSRARRGPARPARIIAKMNSLVDPGAISGRSTTPREPA